MHPWPGFPIRRRQPRARAEGPIAPRSLRPDARKRGGASPSANDLQCNHPNRLARPEGCARAAANCRVTARSRGCCVVRPSLRVGAHPLLRSRRHDRAETSRCSVRGDFRRHGKGGDQRLHLEAGRATACATRRLALGTKHKPGLAAVECSSVATSVWCRDGVRPAARCCEKSVFRGRLSRGIITISSSTCTQS